MATFKKSEMEHGSRERKKEEETTFSLDRTPLFGSGVSKLVTDESTENAWWLREPPDPAKKKKFPKMDISPSRVSLTQTCMFKYHNRYRLKREDVSGYAALVGKVVHQALEDAGRRRVERKATGLKKVIPWVATTEELLHLVEHAPAQLARAGEKESITTNMLDDARKILVTNGPVNFQFSWAVEHPFELQLDHRYFVGGFIDRIDLLPDSVNPKRVLVTDYKTSQELVTASDLMLDPQAGIYTRWARKRWPEADEIIFAIRNVRHGATITMRYQDHLGELTMATARAAINLVNSGDMTARAGDHCRWCPYRDGDAEYKPCNAYQRMLTKLRHANKNEDPHGLDARALDDLIAECRQSVVAQGILEDRISELRPKIMEKMGKETKYIAGPYEASVQRNRITSWDNTALMLRDLSSASGEPVDVLIRNITELKKGKLEAWVETLSADKREAALGVIDNYRAQGLGKPYLKIIDKGELF